MWLRSPSSPFELVTFIVFGLIALLGAVATVTVRNPIRSAVG